MTAGEVAWETARAVYSLGLLALGVVIIAALAPAARVLRDLTAALTSTAAVLRAAAGDEKSALEDIRAGLERVEKAQQADASAVHAELAEIKRALNDLLKQRS